MALYKVVNMVAFAVVLLLELATLEVEACRCLAPGLYEGFEAADVVLHATALHRSEQMDTDESVRYIVDVITVYKEEPNVTYAQEMSFVSAGNTLLCGVTLEIGEEYLIGLSRHNEGFFVASKCGLVRGWNSLSDEDKASIEGGCEDDPCDESCGEFQECLYFHFGSPGEYYCADVCHPSPCAHGEVCTLEDVQCVQAPCPPVANCTASSN